MCQTKTLRLFILLSNSEAKQYRNDRPRHRRKSEAMERATARKDEQAGAQDAVVDNGKIEQPAFVLEAVALYKEVCDGVSIAEWHVGACDGERLVTSGGIRHPDVAILSDWYDRKRAREFIAVNLAGDVCRYSHVDWLDEYC